MRPLRSTALGALALSLLVLPISDATGTTPEHAKDSDLVRGTVTQVEPSATAANVQNYPGDPQSEPLVVVAEDQRLIRVRSAAVAMRLRGEKLVSPYRVATGASRTLVLTPRPAPYTLQDLTTLAPESFVKESSGSYLLSENLLIQAGATLSLGAPGGLTLHLTSTPAGFVSIINDGGRLEVNGTADSPVNVSSWDPGTGKPDAVTSDGRAYLRSIGGVTIITGAHVDSLGFWSGRTGGISITGTDRATTVSHPPAAPAVPKTPAPKNAGPEPAGVRLFEADSGAPADNYATGSIKDTIISDNAFGIFATKARNMEIRNVSVQESLVDGIVLHRLVTQVQVTDTTAAHNVGNGFVLDRATTGIELNNTRADFNGQSGILIKGLPLADGPSAGGDAGTGSSGHAVSGSLADGNRRYGIEVIAGRSISLRGNTITGNDRGIDLSHAVGDVQVVGNRFENQRTRSVSVTDGAPGTIVDNNTVAGGTTGIYLRNSPGTVTNNTMSELTLHGITINGDRPVQMHANTMSGSGPSALNLRDSHGSVTRSGNDTNGWDKTEPFWVQVGNFFQPLTVIWTILALILLVTSIKGGRPRRRVAVHPYAAQAPLASFTASSSPDGGPGMPQQQAVRPVSNDAPDIALDRS